jgi:D-alanyl-D-alanine carboxypeptidase (penicillin-binding protein 5/6)
MYLIFSAALKNDVFRQIISTDTYQAIYQAADGSRQEQTWNNTNQYLSGARTAPYGFTVIGGKTGTTYEAGYCLVLYCTNDQDQEIISIVYNADCALNLYYLMNELLYTFGEAQ